MSGSRTKELRRAFILKHGRAPRRSVQTYGDAIGPSFTLDAKGNKRPWRDVVKIAASRFARLWTPAGVIPAKDGTPAKDSPHKLVEMFVRKVFSVTVTEPSEWRRWKKQNRRTA